MSNRITVISCGYGVQSTTMIAMSALGDLDRPNYIIHADTLHERQETYEYARWLNDWSASRGVSIVTVKNNGYQIGDQTNNVTIPAFTTYLDGRLGCCAVSALIAGRLLQFGGFFRPS